MITFVVSKSVSRILQSKCRLSVPLIPNPDHFIRNAFIPQLSSYVVESVISFLGFFSKLKNVFFLKRLVELARVDLLKSREEVAEGMKQWFPLRAVPFYLRYGSQEGKCLFQGGGFKDSLRKVDGKASPLLRAPLYSTLRQSELAQEIQALQF